MSSIAFEVHGAPVPQGSVRAIPVRGRAVVVNNSGQRHALWRNAIVVAAQQAVPEGWDTGGPMAVEMAFRMPRPKSHSTAKGLLRPSAPHLHTQTPDLDKLARAACDAITAAGVWGDDAQLARLGATKTWAGPGSAPGLRITIHRIEQETA